MTREPVVHAVLGRLDAELERAVRAQSYAVAEIAEAGDGTGQPDWIWLLDGTALPRPDALCELIGAAGRLEGVEAPVLLASRVVAPDGRLAAAHVPIPPQDRTAVAVRTVGLHVLPVRAVSGASLLVRRGTAHRRAGAGYAATIAWTAGLLRDGEGFLVPGSVADVRDVRVRRSDQAALATRLLAGPGLSGRERLRLAGELVERAAARPRG